MSPASDKISSTDGPAVLPLPSGRKSLMIMKEPFVRPAVLAEVRMTPESAFLAGSIIDEITEVATTGQETDDYDFSYDGFNHSWEHGDTWE